MENALPIRQHQILIYLIREFIETAEPVGSATLTRKYGISASPATIRNDMAKLEDEGYLYQPHTSAGRNPTDKGYRYYVNYLLEQKICIPQDYFSILNEYERFEAHIHQLLEHTSKVLADQTHFTSLVLAPRLRRTMFKYLRLASIEDNQVLIILMTNTGAIINKVIRLEKSLTPEHLERMTNILNERLEGMFLGDIQLDFLEKIESGMQKDILEHISILTRETLQEEDTGFIYDGAVNLLDVPEFQNLERLKIIMELLEDEKLVGDILKKTISTEGIKVYIGSELSVDPARECSFIMATYQIANIPVGAIGVLGPTRMPYQRIIPIVDAFSGIFSRKLSKLADKNE